MTLRISLGYEGDISYALTLLSVLLVLDQKSSWGTWLHTAEYQIKAINNLQPPRNLKEFQKLTGMTDTLNRFISRSAYKCRPFF